MQESYIVGCGRIRIAQTFVKYYTRNFYNHGLTNLIFPIFYEPPQNSRRPKADMRDLQILAATFDIVLDTTTWRPGFVYYKKHNSDLKDENKVLQLHWEPEKLLHHNNFPSRDPNRPPIEKKKRSRRGVHKSWVSDLSGD